MSGSPLVGGERGHRLQAGLDAGDPEGEVGAAYLAKELLREVYSTSSPGQARCHLAAFYAHCATVDVAELERLAKTVRRWEHEILGWHRTGDAARRNSPGLLTESPHLVGFGF